MGRLRLLFLTLALFAPVLRLPAADAPAGMTLIPAGTFVMGSPETEEGRNSDEGPRREVTLSAFYLGTHEVTVREFQEFAVSAKYKTQAETSGGGYALADGHWGIQENAAWKNPGFTQRDDEPVTLVSWFDAVHYCNWRSKREGLSPAYTISSGSVSLNPGASGFRLPTEAEWEYACRAGTTTAFSTGNDITTKEANFNGYGPYRKGRPGEYRGKPAVAGSFAANAWGLYDMHGNVAEWCGDWYGSYPGGGETNPTGPASGRRKVIRGGGWDIPARYLRSAARVLNAPWYRSSYLGFRLARPAK
ncbi:MAG: Formylglycine-generating enzyme [Treponematales bacterium]